MTTRINNQCLTYQVSTCLKFRICHICLYIFHIWIVFVSMCCTRVTRDDYTQAYRAIYPHTGTVSQSEPLRKVLHVQASPRTKQSASCRYNWKGQYIYKYMYMYHIYIWYMYIYIYVYGEIDIYIYVYIQRERESDR